MLVSADRLSAALTSFGTDYTNLVFNRYTQPPGSISRAAESQAPTLRDVTNFFSRGATLMWLRFHIAETFAFLGIYETVSKRQIVQTAELIYDHEVFGQLNLDEFLQFLCQFKRGDYGKIYQSARPNPQEFLLCLRPFWNELVEQRIRIEKKRQQLLEQARRDDCMTRDEYEEIKMLTLMYNPPAPPSCLETTKQ